MNKIFALMAAIALLFMGAVAQANVFNLGTGFTNLETVTVGDPGNIGELSGWSAGGFGPDRVCGSVNYTYNIGKYEVTAKQYTDFLNAKAKTDNYGLYNSYMGDSSVLGCKIQRSGSSGNYIYSVASDYANRPVNYVSYWDACRFTNWLSNGQGNGDTETGTYTLNGYTGKDGRTIDRNAGAKWAVTSEDEWYKAAYYKGGGTNTGYWDYATQSNTIPSNVLNDPANPNNIATYYIDNNVFTIGAPYYRTEVGTHRTSESAYGTYDQCGNVWEMNECVVHEGTGYRGIRGASYIYFGTALQASYRYGVPIDETRDLGFRVVQIVPEPSSILAMLSGLVGLGGIALRRRR